MKKRIFVLLLATLMLCMMTGCNLAEASKEATGRVEEMLEALTDGDAEGALAMMHPDVSEDAEDAIDQMIDYIDGREVEKIEQTNFGVNTSLDGGGKTRTEEGGFQVSFDDGTKIHVAATYTIDDDGEGFSRFQLELDIS